MKPFPYLIDAKDIKALTHQELDYFRWLEDQREELKAGLSLHAAILFRNFPVYTKKDLEKFVSTLVPEELILDYTGGTSPREKIGKGIYSSTKMPFFLKIPLHSEMAYRKKFPKIVIFHCEKAPLLGGETPIVDIRKVYQDIPKDLREKLEREQIIYFRHLKNYTLAKKLLSKLNPMVETGTWQFVFKTNDPNVVNKYCDENAYEYHWQKDGSVILTTKLPATLIHSKTGEKVWFNSAHFFQVHSRIWGKIITPIYKLMQFLFRAQNLNAKTGQQNILSSDEISSIVDAYEKNEIKFRWQEGDVLLLDNTLTAHGRNPYLGKRRILVSLAQEGSF